MVDPGWSRIGPDPAIRAWAENACAPNCTDSVCRAFLAIVPAGIEKRDQARIGALNSKTSNSWP